MSEGGQWPPSDGNYFNLPETSSIPMPVWLAGTSALDDWAHWGIYALWSYLIVLASRSSHGMSYGSLDHIPAS